MRTTLLTATSLLGMASFVWSMPGPPAAEERLLVNNSVFINSLAIEQTNLIFRVVFPAGMEQVALERCETLGTPWQETASIAVAPEGGEFAFSIPKPATPMQLFRLRAKPRSSASPVVSRELQYVAMPSLAASPTNAVFHFQGLVDGSDRIVISRNGALWEHINWDWPPAPVTVNEKQWNPVEKNYVTSSGISEFLPEPFSLGSARLNILKARDVVALELTNKALVVYIDDTPLGPGEYDFTITFQTSAPENVPSKSIALPTRLKIAAQIDGSEALRITAREATWEHKSFQWPTGVSINGIPWSPDQQPVLKNEGTNTFLPGAVDFSTAKIVNRKGRDLATLWSEKDAVIIHFADNPNGSDYYELDISFDR